MFMTDVKTHFSWSRLQAFLLDDEELELSLPHTPHSKYHSPGYLAKVVKTTHSTRHTATNFLYPNCFAYFGNILKHKVIKMNPSEPGESVTNGQTRNVQPPASAALRAKQQRPKKGETVVGCDDHIQQHFSVLAPELPSLERRNWLIHLHYVRKEFEVRLQKKLHLSFYA